MPLRKAKAKAPPSRRRAATERTALPRAVTTISGEDVPSRILRAAYDAFMARGYAGTSTLEIATRAKVSKRELYAHFGSKQAMLTTCIGFGVQTMRTPLELPPARDRSSLAQLLASFGANFLRVVLGPHVVGLYRLALAERDRSPEVAAALDSAGRGGARAALDEIVVKAQQAGLLGGGSDPALVTSRYFALLMGDWYLRVLLGVMAPPSEAEIAARAKLTADELLLLYPPP